MRINYSVHHSLLDHEIIKELKGNKKRITWQVWCMIMHISHHTKSESCTFYQRQWAKDMGYGQQHVREAVQHLLKNKMIKLLVPYCRKTQTGAVYTMDTACIQIATKLYPKGHRAVSQVDKVNNINNIKGELDSFLKSNPQYQKMYQSAIEREGIERARKMIQNVM